MLFLNTLICLREPFWFIPPAWTSAEKRSENGWIRCTTGLETCPVKYILIDFNWPTSNNKLDSLLLPFRVEKILENSFLRYIWDSDIVLFDKFKKPIFS